MSAIPETAKYQIVVNSVPTFYFIGVTTGKSSIMKLFPLWAIELGRPEIMMEGIDLKIHDQPDNYRQATAQIKYDPLSLGALVTTHKIDLLEAARDMFDYLDPYAQICGEVSSISKRAGQLRGHAKDPITAGLSMDAILCKDYFSRTGGEVLIFGAGELIGRHPRRAFRSGWRAGCGAACGSSTGSTATPRASWSSP